MLRAEAELVSAYARGDRRAAELLVERSYQRLYRALHRLCSGDCELAADLTQETYRKAWQGLASFDGRASFSTWLYSIGYRTFLNHVRGNQVVGSSEQALMMIADHSPGPHEQLRAGEDQQRVRRAVLALPDGLRFVVTARFWSGLPTREIARLEGVTPTAVRKRLTKALDVLRGELGEALEQMP